MKSNNQGLSFFILAIFLVVRGLSKNVHFEGSLARRIAGVGREESTEQENPSSGPSQRYGGDKSSFEWTISILSIVLVIVAVCVAVVIVTAYFRRKKQPAKDDEKAVLGPLEEEGPRTRSGLVFFAEEREKFALEDLLEATADLRSHSLCSSLYKVALKNDGAYYAVKRLRNDLQVSISDFSKIAAEIGAAKHENILPLVAYSFTPEDKLMIYKYQIKETLLNLLQDCIEGKREFQWRLRVSIARGIARGLSFIYENTNEKKMVIPHGNIKLSNILINENEEPLISDFGDSKFLDPNGLGLCSTKGYMAPEKGLNEKSDIYSFGVVLLELLTGRSVEKTGVDLPKWVNSMIREEWTGEVFDKRLSESETRWAFPLLNVALKCASKLPENRPTFSEVSERIDEVFSGDELDHDMSKYSSSSTNECHHHQDYCHLHTIIPETWDTPGSNY